MSTTNPSSSYPILCTSFNQDNSCFVIGTKDGFKIFDAKTGTLLYERAAGACIIVEMLFSSSLLAIVGAGEQPSLSPRRLCLFNTATGSPIRELNFLTSILAVRVNKKRLAVILQDKTYIYDTGTLEILETIDTVPNLKGRNEVGSYQSTIFSLSFGPSTKLPGILLATSSSGSVRTFFLGLALNQRIRKSNFLGAMIRDSLSDVLDPTHHHILHHAVPAGVKSNAVVWKTDRVTDTSTSETMALRSTISIITSSSYFLDYSCCVNRKNECTWMLERELNLLSAISEQTSR
ncbi:scaffold/adaptor protein [Lithospermum erythrorhizon]|uniref:Scaffold/adaptor protein n=1 Tax=Lithospermum erythrorhizon TaxID=34254 RepID=A0AAV3PZW4_LITER